MATKKTLTFDSEEYEQAFDTAQEIHDSGNPVSIEINDGKIRISWEEHDEG